MKGFSSLRLTTKLAVLSAALTALFITLTLLPLSVSIRRSTRDIVSTELQQTQRALIANQERELVRLEYAATLIGQNSTVLAAIAEDRTQAQVNGGRRGLQPALRATVEQVLREELRNVGQDLVLITDDSGSVFSVASIDSAQIEPRTNLRTMHAVQVALDPDIRADTGVYGVLNTGNRYYSVASVPLVTAGRTLGAVLLGERIDGSYLRHVQSAFKGTAVVTAGDRVIASTTPGASTPRGDDKDVTAPLSLGKTVDGAPVTLWLVQPVSEISGSLTRSIVLQFIFYGLIAIVLSALGAAATAQSVLQPLHRFIRYMRGVKPGAQPPPRPDLSTASPEIRTLDKSFASLMESLNASEAQLRQSQKLEAIGTLAGGVAHDFNNLLTVITGYSQLAMMRIAKDDSLREDLVQVIEASERASRLTHQLLAFSRKQKLQPELLDLSEVVDGITPMLRRLIGENIRIAVETSPSIGKVLADRGQIEQVIINLVVNARDAMPDGGRIAIRTDNVVPNAVRDPSPSSECCVLLSVSDTGTGIPKELRDRVFEPFFTTKEQGKGTGLGLSMVYGIVTQSGGTISLESEPGKGTTFTMQFPRVQQAVSAPESDPVAVAMPTGTGDILLIEDEPDLRALAQRTLESVGYTVTAPEHTEDALALAQARSFDLILTDIVMPVMSGPQIVERLAKLGIRPIVVYMSGYADDAISQYRIGDALLLRKPFSPSQLAQMIRNALDRTVAR